MITNKKGKSMKYKCLICGYIYDDNKENIPFSELPDNWKCPVCGAPKSMFEPLKEVNDQPKEVKEVKVSTIESYLKEYERTNDNIEVHMDEIHEMSKTGESIISAMGTTLPVISWKDILILGSQLN